MTLKRPAQVQTAECTSGSPPAARSAARRPPSLTAPAEFVLETGDVLYLTQQCKPVSGVIARRWEFRSEHPAPGDAGCHADLELSWMESGAVNYQVGARTHNLRTGAVVLVPPGVEHLTSFAAGPMRSVVIRVGGDLVAEVTDAMGPKWHNRGLEFGILENSESVVRLGHHLLEEGLSQDDGGKRLVCRSLAEILVVEMLRLTPFRNDATPRSDIRITRAIDQVEACFDQTLTVDDLARTAGMTRFHFSRRFREVVGQSPYRFLIQTRLSRAAVELRSGRCSVTQAALNAGFKDLGRFSRRFREWSGQLPHQYARR